MITAIENHRSRLAHLLADLPELSRETLLQQVRDLRTHARKNLDTDREALLCCLFLDAITDYLDGRKATNGHLYLERFEIPQIRLFDLLISKFPFVSASHSISNSLISKWLTGKKGVVLDVGIGRGIQMASLIKKLSENKGLKELTIIGIEPFVDAILHAEKVIRQAAANAHFKVNLHIVEGFAEKVEFDTVRKHLPANYSKLVINASLAAHHIPSISQREYFFNQAAKLDPDAIVLTEPHSDHMTNDWARRTVNAWVHYGAIFDTIDHLEIPADDKNGLKMFFGREIKDVVGTPDAERFERHEPCAHWQWYGQNIGMMPCVTGVLPSDEIVSGPVNVSFEDDVIMMKYKTTDVLAVIPLMKSSSLN